MKKACAHARSIAALGIVLAGVLLLCCPDALALDPTLDVSQYAHTSWKVRDGFTKGAIFAIAQTPDGYLWLGTESGLVRFDGVRPVPWQSPAGQQLPSNFISALLVARDGTLWIGTLKGLGSWKDGKFSVYRDLGDSVITALIEDHEGTVWIGRTEIQVAISAQQGFELSSVTEPPVLGLPWTLFMKTAKAVFGSHPGRVFGVGDPAHPSVTTIPAA